MNEELAKWIVGNIIENRYLIMDGGGFDGPQDAQIEMECIVTWLQVNE